MTNQTVPANNTDRLRMDADQIIRQSIHAVLPDEAVRRALKGINFLGKVYLVAIRKSCLEDGGGCCRQPVQTD